MSRKKSRYRPRGVNPQAHLVALQGCTRLTQDDALRFALPAREAVAAVCKGCATQAHWSALFAALAVAELLVRQRVAQDADGAIGATQAALLDILARDCTRGTRALYPDEVATLDAFAANYADLICQVTHSELFQAEEAAQIRIAAAAAGNGDPSVVFAKAPDRFFSSQYPPTDCA